MSKAKSKQPASSSAVAPVATPSEAMKPPAAPKRTPATSARAMPASAQPKPLAEAKSVARPPSKLEQVIVLLKGKNGATIDQLVKATEWQPHSIRGAISGAIKKRLGLKVTSQVRDGARTYRIER